MRESMREKYFANIRVAQSLGARLKSTSDRLVEAYRTAQVRVSEANETRNCDVLQQIESQHRPLSQVYNTLRSRPHGQIKRNRITPLVYPSEEAL